LRQRKKREKEGKGMEKGKLRDGLGVARIYFAAGCGVHSIYLKS